MRTLAVVTRSLFQSEAVAGPFVRVAIECSVDHPEGLTYSVPAEVGPVRVGDRVEAPLGRGDRPAPGFVIDVQTAPDLDPERIKPILRRGRVALSPALIDLARWMARYYCCPLGVVLAAMTPAAVKRGVGLRVKRLIERTGAEPADRLPPATKEAWEAIRALPDDAFPIAAKTLAQRIDVRTARPINRLIEIGLLRTVLRSAVRALEAPLDVVADKPVEPTEAQRAAIEAITGTLGTFAQHLLFGVTGSGKTEVYLRVLERTLARGEGAIVLVPEISLTPQTVGRFRARFAGEAMAVLHSGLTAAQRHREWTRVASGEARLVIGARSAIFAPFGGERGPRLGLIVIDEEHDTAYKQDEAPRLHARDVALKRAQIESCPVVMGSATPSLETWHRAQRSACALHVLPRRVGGAALPAVEVVDLREELRMEPDARTRLTLLGPRLRRALGEALERGGQAILMLNRRGYANYICCPDHRCGWLLTCEQCDVTMVYHRDRRLPLGGLVRCHHCLASSRMPEVCPACGRRITSFGVGTQRVEAELKSRFAALAQPGALLRLDADTMRSARHYHEALGRFGRGEARAMLGTQMIAKGLDYPGVELVGVINADTAIHLPDFRAAERTFQLISQVAGRAGRARERPGRVIVQTFNPEEPAVQRAARHDYPGFAQGELALRESAALPPLARMARIVVRHEQDERASAHAAEIAAALKQAAGGEASVRIRGPMACPISRISGRWRMAVEVTAPTPGVIQRLLTELRNRGLARSDALTAVDVDPIALL